MNIMPVSYNAIRIQLLNQIRKMKTQCGISSCCTYRDDSRIICEYLHLSLIPENLSNDEYAFYSRKEKFIAIDLEKGTPERVNFSFFHEITHHIIENDNELYYALTELAGDKKVLDDIEEELANTGAAEFLMPSEEIREIIGQKGFCIKLFPEIYEKYPASRQAVLVQMAQCTSHKCILCMCGSTKDNNLSDRLMVEFSTKSPSTKYSIGKNHLIPLDHYLNNVSESTPFLTDRKAQVPYKKSDKIHKTNSEGLFYDGKVYALFNLTEAPFSRSDAPTLF